MRLFLFILSLFCISESSYSTCKIVEARSGLTVRYRPNGHRCGALKNGSKVDLISSCRNSWCPISYAGSCGGRGWIFRKHLRNCPSAPIASKSDVSDSHQNSLLGFRTRSSLSPSPSPSPSQDPISAREASLVKRKASLLGEAKAEGETLRVSPVVHRREKASAGDLPTTGAAAAGSLRKSPTYSSKTTRPDSTYLPTALKFSPSSAFKTSEIGASEIEVENTGESCYRVTVKSRLNVRYKPGKSHRVCAILSNGVELQAKGACRGNWCPVALGGSCGGRGWIAKSHGSKALFEDCRTITDPRYAAAEKGKGLSIDSTISEESQAEESLDRTPSSFALGTYMATDHNIFKAPKLEELSLAIDENGSGDLSRGGRAVQKLDAQLTEIEKKGRTDCRYNTRNAAQCLVCSCINESGNQKDEGKMAVGRVVLSRVKARAFPSTVCGVVWQETQFAWTIGSGKGKKGRRMSVPILRGSALRSCVKQTRRAVEKEMIENPYRTYALNYHAEYVSPSWARGCRLAETIQDHLFYYDCHTQTNAPIKTAEISERAIAWIFN